MNRSSVLGAIIFLGASAAQALAPGDGVVILYKDGSKVSGVLVAQTPAEVTIDAGGAELTSSLADVGSIVVKRTAVQRFQEQLQAAGNDPTKLRAAAEFARSHRLHTYYDTLAKRLGLPTDNAGAPLATVQAPSPRKTTPAPPARQPPPIDPEIHGAPLPILGYASNNTVEIDSGEDFEAGAALHRERDHDDAANFLRTQALAREARTHEVTNPTSDMEFKLQQALDRQARGLPFAAP